MMLLLLIMMPAFAQDITIPESEPCFMHFENGTSIWTECGIQDDFLTFALTPFEYTTGGYFSILLISVMVLISYLKYHKAIYPMMIGILYFPSVYFLFPPSYVSFAMTFMAIGYGLMIWFVFVRQTSDK